jgi:thiamine-monophosphate kinase
LPLAEKALIARIRRMAASYPGILTGIGDDCAVLRLRPVREILVTTDLTLEGIHFRTDWHSPESVGHRCLVRGLSDIAAMGGEPVAAFISIALPRKLRQSWVDWFVRGLMRAADKYGVSVAGGDTAESPRGIMADIVVVGSVPKGKAVLRSGARPGDRICATGELGGSEAALRLMQKKPKRKLNPRRFLRHFFPEPRLGVGCLLREKGLATAMIDTSDGLSTDLAHICEESGVGAELWTQAIPRASVGRPARKVDLQLALHGGEDYELIFTIRRGKRVPKRIGGVPITEIGRITRGKRIFLKNEAGARHELQAKGWEHFR